MYNSIWRGVLAITGLLLALLGPTFINSPVLYDDVLVWINHQPITAQNLRQVTQRLESVSQAAIGTESSKRLLELLVDEELLLQHAESMDIFQKDPGLRKLMAQAVIDEVVTRFLNASVTEPVLLAFYRHHRTVFEHPRTVAVSVVGFSSLADAEQARVRMLAGERISALDNRVNTEILTHLPSSLLPAQGLIRYLGPTLASMALNLDPGEVTDPVPRADGFYLAQVRATKPAYLPEFESVKPAVKMEYLRRGRDDALAKTLASLWAGANVDINRNLVGSLVLTDQRKILSNLDAQ
jgi:hypothetical protein